MSASQVQMSGPSNSELYIKKVRVWVNMFEINRLPDKLLCYQYQAIDPMHASSRVNQEIINRMQLENASTFTSRALYDGRHLLFTTKELPEIMRFEVQMRRDRSKPHVVTLTRVASINMQVLRELTSGRAQSANDPALTYLNLTVRQAPNLRHNFEAHARAFFMERTLKELGMGLCTMRGYFQSVRPAMGRFLVNINTTVGVFYAPGTLIELMFGILEIKPRDQNPRRLQRLEPQERARLRMGLKGVRIKVRFPRDMRPMPIVDIANAAGLQEFDKDGERTTVQQHFQSKYNVRLKFPEMVGVRIGKTAIIPAEMCEVAPGQFYHKRLQPNLQRLYLEQANQSPSDRRRQILDAVSRDEFNYRTSDFMKDVGMTINEEMLSVEGVMLCPPSIHFKNRSVLPRDMQTNPGKWNLVGKQFFSVDRPLKLWAVAILDPAADSNQVSSFVQRLARNLTKLGMEVEPPKASLYCNPSDPVNDLKNFKHAQLILVILPENAQETRLKVKSWGDMTGRPTVCVRGGKWNTADDQYCNNLALKINSRTGGVNFVVRSAASEFMSRSVIVGADVGHPGSGIMNRPSVTGLVASVDKDISRFTSFANVQNPRVESIRDLEQMMVDALKDWQSYRANVEKDVRPPANVVFYRDGVSEGEYARVAREEIPMIQRAFERMRLVGDRRPNLLFIIVTKRHHVRTFPQRPEDGDRKGNCLPGILIDSEITNPNYHAFYLLAHAGILGTSRPAHYTVLQNEGNHDPRLIYTMTYHLCHTYAGATRSVSIPAPVFYADQVCSSSRLDIHCSESGMPDDTTASNASEGGSNAAEPAAFPLQEWKNAFKQTPLHRWFAYMSGSS